MTSAADVVAPGRTVLSVGDRSVVVVYLLGLQFFYSWAWSSSDVLRPLFRQNYDLSFAEAGSAYSAQVVGALFGALVVGRIQHAAGRRAALMLTGVGCGLTLAAGALVDDLLGLVVQRSALGLFMGAVFPVTVGLIVDLFPARTRGRLASLVDGTYFAAVIAMGWAAAAWVEVDWQLLFWPAGVLLVLIGLGALLLRLPDHPVDRTEKAPRARDLFGATLRRRTAALTCLIAANACGHQAFTGWLTVYLREVDQLSYSAVAATLTAQYVGSILGCFAWGYIVDHWGRRVGAIGLWGAGLFAALFVVVVGPLWVKQLAAFSFGFAFSAVVTIGPWLAELYPPALRAPATAIFQWGRFVSLVAPPATGLAAASLGLPVVMGLAASAFAISGMIWWALPETHHHTWEPRLSRPEPGVP